LDSEDSCVRLFSFEIAPAQACSSSCRHLDETLVSTSHDDDICPEWRMAQMTQPRAGVSAITTATRRSRRPCRQSRGLERRTRASGHGFRIARADAGPSGFWCLAAPPAPLPWRPVAPFPSLGAWAAKPVARSTIGSRDNRR